MTGSNEKCRWLVEDLGAYAAINYRTDNVDQCLEKLFPDGIDVMFDNVGGQLLNTALDHLAMNARVALCGFIATDYKAGPLAGPINYRELIHRRARMQGFVVFDYWERWAEAEAALLDWYRDGKLVNCEDVDEGLEKDAGRAGQSLHRRQPGHQDLSRRAGPGRTAGRLTDQAPDNSGA